jgi:hypothetical protein
MKKFQKKFQKNGTWALYDLYIRKESYRGISLLCTTYKIFSNILFKRLAPYADVIGDYQCGFRQGRSTSDQIFNLCQVVEKCNEFGIETHHLFIDFRAANFRSQRNLLP